MKAALWPIALYLMACGSSEAPASGPTERPRGVRAVSEVAPTAKPAAPAPAPVDPGSALAEPLPAAAVEAKKKDDAPPRDYGAELLAALGAPVDCLHARSGPDVPSELRIDVQAHVLESGFISRAYVRSPALDEQEVQCLTKRAGALRLAAPVEAAPRAVNTTLTLTLKAAEKPAAEKPPEGAEPKPAETP